MAPTSGETEESDAQLEVCVCARALFDVSRLSNSIPGSVHSRFLVVFIAQTALTKCNITLIHYQEKWKNVGRYISNISIFKLSFKLGFCNRHRKSKRETV